MTIFQKNINIFQFQKLIFQDYIFVFFFLKKMLTATNEIHIYKCYVFIYKAKYHKHFLQLLKHFFFFNLKSYPSSDDLSPRKLRRLCLWVKQKYFILLKKNFKGKLFLLEKMKIHCFLFTISFLILFFSINFQVRFPQQRDSGVYECQVSTTPPIGYSMTLSVVGEVIFFFFRFLILRKSNFKSDTI